MMNKELILSNLREIIAASNGQNTYQSYLAQTTIDAIEAEESAKATELEAVKEAAKQRVLEGRAFMKELFSTLLWLYRRLPRGYNAPPHINSVVRELAKRTGSEEAAEKIINDRKESV